jgi:hypothetical protein
MPNGKPGDHPITDILVHRLHPFGGGIEEEIENIANEFGEKGMRKLDALVFSPAFKDAEARINEQRRILRDLLTDGWNQLILERRRREQ